MPACLPSDLISLHRAVRVRPGLRVERDDVGARVGKILHILVDRRNHQMDVERLCAVRAQRLHHGRADGDVGHEMAVHHIDMDPVAACFVDRANFFTQTREIGGQDRRGDTDGSAHGWRLADCAAGARHRPFTAQLIHGFIHRVVAKTARCGPLLRRWPARNRKPSFSATAREARLPGSMMQRISGAFRRPSAHSAPPPSLR
jgi:hypothetical protein